MRHVEFTRIKGGDTKCINFSINIIQYRLIVERHVAQTTYLHIYTRTHVNTNALVVIKNFYEKFFYERTKRKTSQELFRKILFFLREEEFFRIQRGCNCTSTMVVPKETNTEEEEEKKKGIIIERSNRKKGWGKKKRMISIERNLESLRGSNLDEAQNRISPSSFDFQTELFFTRFNIDSHD